MSSTNDATVQAVQRPNFGP